jgi:hypothetical protein
MTSRRLKRLIRMRPYRFEDRIASSLAKSSGEREPSEPYGDLVTHLVPIGDFDGPHPFFDLAHKAKVAE